MRPRRRRRGELPLVVDGVMVGVELQCGHGVAAVENHSRCNWLISRCLERAVRAGWRWKVLGKVKTRYLIT